VDKYGDHYGESIDSVFNFFGAEISHLGDTIIGLALTGQLGEAATSP
jgi:hypothetical protein